MQLGSEMSDKLEDGNRMFGYFLPEIDCPPSPTPYPILTIDYYDKGDRTRKCWLAQSLGGSICRVVDSKISAFNLT